MRKNARKWIFCIYFVSKRPIADSQIESPRTYKTIWQVKQTPPTNYRINHISLRLLSSYELGTLLYPRNLGSGIKTRRGKKGRAQHNTGKIYNMLQANKTESSLRMKRRMNDDEPETGYPIKEKRIKSDKVIGQPLSIDRMIDTLNKQDLSELISKLIDSRPDITADVIRLSPKLSAEDCVRCLREKVDKIVGSLPYKVDPVSEYAFLRVKSLCFDFFQSLSDYILNFLPPVNNDTVDILDFLTKFLLQVLYRLPAFENGEFNHYYRLTIDKINHIYVESLSKFIQEKQANIYILLDGGWSKDIEEINRLNNGDFARVCNFLESTMKDYQDQQILQNGSKLRGLDSLLANENALPGVWC